MFRSNVLTLSSRALAATLLVLALFTTVAAQPPAPVNVNTATQAELERLPGVGPSRAQAIIEQRMRRPFRRAQDLRRVPGIGPKMLQRLAPHVTFEDPPRAAR